MEKIKIIDLLNKIANGEEVPEYINYIHRAFGKDTMMVCKENIIDKLDTGAIELNDEVETLEEDKKIRKIFYAIKNEDDNKKLLYKAVDKINEIIDYINKENK